MSSIPHHAHQFHPLTHPAPSPPGADINSVPASGPSPVMIRFEDWLVLGPDYEHTTTVMEKDPVMVKALGKQ